MHCFFKGILLWEKRETVCTLEANNEQKPTRNSPQTQIESGNNCSQRIIRHIIPIACLVYNMYIYLHTPLYIAVDNRCTVGLLFVGGLGFFDRLKPFFRLHSGYTKTEGSIKNTSKTMFFQTQNTENKGKEEDTLYIESNYISLHLMQDKGNCFWDRTMMP